MNPVQRIAVTTVMLSMAFAASRSHAVEPVVAATESFPEFAATSPAATPSPISQGLPKAPIGHRQPNARNVPAGVLHQEQMIDPSETEFDKKLQICRRC